MYVYTVECTIWIHIPTRSLFLSHTRTIDGYYCHVQRRAVYEVVEFSIAPNLSGANIYVLLCTIIVIYNNSSTILVLTMTV